MVVCPKSTEQLLRDMTQDRINGTCDLIAETLMRHVLGLRGCGRSEKIFGGSLEASSP